MIMFARLSATVLLALTAASACGNSNNNGSGSASLAVDSGTIFCDSQYKATPPQAIPWSAAMPAQSTDGAVKIQAASNPPMPQPGDQSQWTLTITQNGSPVPAGTAVKFQCLMTHPGYTHGCPLPITVTEMGGGVYMAKPVVFNMPGHWVIQVTVGQAQTQVQFPICVS